MILFCVFLIFVTGRGATTWQGPTNACVVAGNHVTMTCQTPSDFDSISWYFTAFGSTTKLLISDAANVTNAFKDFQVSGDVAGQFLSLQVAQMKHAGQYACTAFMQHSRTSGKLVESTALLIILESEPVCSLKTRHVKVGLDIEMVCSVNFSGPFPPKMEWKQHMAQGDPDGGSVIRDGQINTADSTSSVTSTARIAAVINRHNSTYSCRTYFTLPTSTPLGVNATNAPDYNYKWTSPSIQVMYGPIDVAIVPKQDVFYPGDVLTCLAEASPSPEFVWRSVDTGKVVTGPELVIRNSMIRDQPYVFECHITHELADSELTSHSIQFTVKNNHCVKTADTNIWIIVGLVFVCVIIIVAVSVHIVCLKRRSKASIAHNGQSRQRDDAVVFAASNNEPVYSEYTEIPSYSVCREAVERSQRPVSNLGYVSMDPKSNSTNRRTVPEAPKNLPTSVCAKNAYQNNEYMRADDDVPGPGYALSTSPLKEIQPNEDEATNTYLNLSQRNTSASTDYATLSSKDGQRLLQEDEGEEKEEQPNEPKGKTEELNDYLVPLPE